MKSSRTNKHRKPARLFALCVALCALAALPLLSSARTPRSASISIANNSGRSIINVYFSHTDQDDWGTNQIGNTPIESGSARTISNVSWDQSQLKVVAEDSNGCFLSTVVSATGDSTWTVTANAPADCGGN